VTDYAKGLGYYVLMDVPDALSYQDAVAGADAFFADGCDWSFDGLILSSYIGSDGIKPYAAKLEDSDKSLFVAVRTGNRSAAEIQDLLTGGRHVFEAKTDVVNRFKNSVATKSGYDRIAIVAPASSGAILRQLREKYKNLFILVDDYDAPNANAKNCSEAADKYGHGSAVCAGASITAAWVDTNRKGLDYVEYAKREADRIKKNLARYYTVL
jgi:orotidine-5'-phosphate decarboxylase